MKICLYILNAQIQIPKLLFLQCKCRHDHVVLLLCPTQALQSRSGQRKLKETM